MSSLQQMPVIPTSGRPCTPAHSADTALPLLHEVRHALARLIATGETTRIDLAAMPVGPGDLDRLLGVLGTGEVQATVEALGPTRIQETEIAGVWVVDYLNPDGQRLALHLEIATVPEILCPQPRDIEDALAALDARLTPDASTLP
jgi:hydrogenase-1 operon protein HyaF